MANLLYGGGHCPDKGSGFQSQARPTSVKGCAPGFVPPMCDTTRRIAGTTTGGGATDDIELGPYQSLQLLAIVDLATAAGVTLDDIIVNGESVFTKFKADQNPGSLLAGLGDIANLTPELYRSGLNPVPPTPLTDQNNQVTLRLSSATALAYDFLVYFGNPAGPGHMMQKNANGNY